MVGYVIYSIIYKGDIVKPVDYKVIRIKKRVNIVDNVLREEIDIPSSGYKAIEVSDSILNTRPKLSFQEYRRQLGLKRRVI